MSKIEEIEELYSDSYKVTLENFQGPLQLLLHLIREAKLDIEEVALAQITGQYLDYIKDVEDLDLENASEFIQVAAILIEMKSKMILPVEAPPEDDDMDEGKMLVYRLKEYEIMHEFIQNTCFDLQRIEDLDKLYKEPDKLAGNVKIVLKDMVLDNLLDAFANLLCRVERKKEDNEPKKIVIDRFTVAEKIISIKSVIKDKKHIKFSELFEEDNTKSEMLNIFLALLELLKLQFVKAKQQELFGEIDIYENEEKIGE